MKNAIFAIMLAIAACGCMTKPPKVEATKPWEGHFFTVEELQQQTSNIQLDEGESIWIMSNYTLNRLLKNVGKK